MPQSSHDLDQQKVRGICGVEHSGLAYDTRYLRISAVSNSNRLNHATKMSNKFAHVCAKCPILELRDFGVPLALPTQKKNFGTPQSGLQDSIGEARAKWRRRHPVDSDGAARNTRPPEL